MKHPRFNLEDLAFPSDRPDQSGMTLRDYFAAKALPIIAKKYEDGHADGWEGIARYAYRVADAMLSERAK